MGDTRAAVNMALHAIEVALKKIESLDDHDEKQDSETIIELMQENIKTWEDELEK